MTLRNKIVSAGLVFALAAPFAYTALPAAVAYADPASDLEAAASRLDELGAGLSDYQAQLAETTTALELKDYEVAEKQAQIEQTQAQLTEKQGLLGSTMRSSYKSGGTQGVLEYVLGSTSPEDLVSRIYYLDKVSDQQASAIEEVRRIEAELKQQMSDLEAAQATLNEQVTTLQTQVDEYQALVAEARDYYNALDAQVQAELAAQESANAQAAIDAAQNNQQGGTSGGTDGGQQGGTDDGGSTSGGDQGGSSGGEDQGGDSGGSSGGDSGGSSVVGGGLSTALAQVGKPYVLGTAGPNTFDCSGLVCYSYGYARGRTTWAMIDSLKSSGDWKTDLSQINVGDLVFPHSGHVGIYMGNGQYVHAANPGVGVIVGPLYGFIGGGSYY